MSDPLRVALAVEGPTDFVVLTAAIRTLLGGRDIETTSLQPELSEAFAATSGGGWTALYFWCREAAEQAGGGLRDNPLFSFHDILVVQIDADVAGFRYSDDQRISNPPNDLPCAQDCPPASATTNALRQVVLGWMGESSIPPKTVFCTTSKSLETWVLVALYPGNRIAQRQNVECHAGTEAQLETQKLKERLIRSGKKDIEKYRQYAPAIAEAWQRVCARCAEAQRFSEDFLAVCNDLP